MWGGIVVSLLWAWGSRLDHQALAQTPSLVPKPADETDFHFSIYFTGNERANLEPCG